MFSMILDRPRDRRSAEEIPERKRSGRGFVTAKEIHWGSKFGRTSENQGWGDEYERENSERYNGR